MTADSNRTTVVAAVFDNAATSGGRSPPSQKFDEYRTNRLPYLLGSPLFFVLGLWAYIQGARKQGGIRFESVFFNGGSKLIREIQENGGNAVALHLLYRLRHLRISLPSAIERYWTNIPIIQAVQNRAVLIRDLLGEIIVCSPNQPRILGLAAGLAEPLLWAIDDCEKRGHFPCDVLLTDIVRRPLEHAREIAKSVLGLKTEVKLERLNLTDTLRVRRVIQRSQPNVVEMIGFCDYCSDEEAVDLLRAIQEELSPGAILVTGNVLPISFPQRLFIEQAYGWPKMRYRTREKLEKLLGSAGYQNIDIRVEPNHIFAIVIAKR
jgi:hypothetical protein